MQSVAPNSNNHLREKIQEILSSDSCTAGVDLRVGFLNGIVHLAGKVDSLIVRE